MFDIDHRLNYPLQIFLLLQAIVYVCLLCLEFVFVLLSVVINITNYLYYNTDDGFFCIFISIFAFSKLLLNGLVSGLLSYLSFFFSFE